MGRLLADGRVRVFAASLLSGAEPAVEFLEALPILERTRMIRLFEKLAALPLGRFLNRQDFCQIRGKIYEFKDHRRRMMCFQNAEGWGVTHGFEKKTNASTPEAEIARAERIMQEHQLLRERERTVISTKQNKPPTRGRR